MRIRLCSCDGEGGEHLEANIPEHELSAFVVNGILWQTLADNHYDDGIPTYEGRLAVIEDLASDPAS